jgi:hypothetical protein
MKKLVFVLVIILYLLCPPSVLAQENSIPFFPLEVGNRWDYFVEIEAPGGLTFYDSLSITIIGTEILPNNKEYFVFSGFPFHRFDYQAKYAREESGKIYFYLIEDSSDCLTFQFDIPQDSFYVDCRGGQIFTGGIYPINLWGNIDIQREQGIFYRFSEHNGIYYYWYENLEYIEYYLMGCKISGQIFGNLIVSNDELQSEIYNFELNQNYPNPFNPSTKISWQSPIGSWQTLKVYDVLGNEVATLVNEFRPAGSYEVEFNLPAGRQGPASSIKHPASGIYFYQLKAGDYLETKKMILLK